MHELMAREVGIIHCSFNRWIESHTGLLSHPTTHLSIHPRTPPSPDRQWGWEIFSAIERGCKTTYGFGNHPDVRNVNRKPEDRMESFFPAETLKYLYLLQSPDHEISLDHYTFNTEAHPTRNFF